MKVDVTKIEGYEQMSAEDKLKAIENYEFAEPDYSGYIPKSQYDKEKESFDKTASELAKVKKELKSKLTEEEQKAIAEKEERERLETELASLRKNALLAEHKSRFLANGYPDDLATGSAKALLDGDYDTFFKNQTAFQTQLVTQLKSDMIAKTPYPQGGSEKHNVMTLKDFRSLSAQDRMKWAEEHPDEYKLLYGG